MSINTRAWTGVIVVTVVMGLVLFISAGTLDYWQAWWYLAIFFIASSLTTMYLMKKDPALLERRLSAGPGAEKERSQKVIMFLAMIGFFALLIVPGLDRRFGWSAVSTPVAIVADVLTLLGFYVIFLVYKENTYTSATIEIAEDQRVISTGPYAIVRHPMYSGGSLYIFAMPLALGSYWGLAAAAFLESVVILRLLDEEKFLARNLQGYTEYKARVRSRLIPRVF